MAARKKNLRVFKIRAGDGYRDVALEPGDLGMLTTVAGGGKAIKGAEAVYGRFAKLGLVRIKPQHDANGFPYLVALLTSDGAQVVAQEHHQAVA